MSVIVFFIVLFTVKSYAFQNSDLLSQYHRINSSNLIQYIDVEEQEGNNYIVSLNVSEMELSDVLQSLTSQINVGLSYDSEADLSRTISMKAENLALFDVLNQLIEGSGLEYLVSPNKNTLVIRSQKKGEKRLQETIVGRVVDAQTGESLPGVNVIIEGTTMGTSSNMEGEYELSVLDLDIVLVFTYIGYQRLEVPVNGRTQIDVELIPEAILGEELVVVGYGIQRAETITGSVSAVQAEEIVTTRTENLVSNIQGKVPGLHVRQRTGEPGVFDNMVSIRGYGNPLIVIDGIVRDGINEFAQLNPTDIEN